MSVLFLWITLPLRTACGRFVYMPFAQPFVSLIAEGTFGTNPAQEIWRCTFKLPILTGSIPSDAQLLAFYTAAAPKFSTYHALSDVGAGSQSFFTAVSGAVVGTDGKYYFGDAAATVRYTLPSPTFGAGTSVHPFTAAMCISMQTTKLRGRASRGRVYWPARSLPVGATDGLVSGSTIINMRNAAVTLIDGINQVAAANLPGTSVVSVMSSLGGGTTGTVTAVSIGRRMDHMESRERSLSEAHIWSDLTSTRELAAKENAEQRAVIEGPEAGFSGI